MSYSSENNIYSADLIKLVEQKPLLWNTYHVSHNNKQLRNQAWESIAADIIGDWANLPDKERFSSLAEIKRKWKNIKDKFTRDQRLKNIMKGSAQKKRKYADILQFLNYTATDKNFLDLEDSKNNQTETNDDQLKTDDTTNFKNEPSSSDCDTTDEPFFASKNILFVDTSTDATDSYLRHYATKNSSTSVSSSSGAKRNIDVSRGDDDGGEDPDKMFLLSMVPMFKNLNERDKIVARIQMTQVLQKLLYPKHGM